VAAINGLPVLYVTSFGPACWLVDREFVAARPVAKTYLPIFQILVDDSWVGSIANCYGTLGAKYRPELTMTRLLDAAGLLPENGGKMWPDLLRHDVPYRSPRF
jgi:hypothetical protein